MAWKVSLRSPNVRERTGVEVTNGSKLLPLADGRSVTARRFKDLTEFISIDLGGADRLSEGEKQLVRRAAALSAECERQEALWARGEAEFDIAAYSTLTNAVRRVFETIGLQRRARDVTPSLSLARVAPAPTPDLSQLSGAELDRLYNLVREDGGSEALRKAVEAHPQHEAEPPIGEHAAGEAPEGRREAGL